ncbi:hypothetical protein LXA43DRAFT_1097857 [Ganoderma leucocontextum]|nr:hypothetical protein LXA43DRAFT_1097857 [Ganoderma leucocontextum]
MSLSTSFTVALPLQPPNPPGSPHMCPPTPSPPPSQNSRPTSIAVSHAICGAQNPSRYPVEEGVALAKGPREVRKSSTRKLRTRPAGRKHGQRYVPIRTAPHRSHRTRNGTRRKAVTSTHGTVTAVGLHGSSCSTSVVSNWPNTSGHDASVPPSPISRESRTAVLAESMVDAQASGHADPKRVSSCSSESRQPQDCDVAPSPPLPGGSVTEAQDATSSLFQKLPKEQYSTAPPVRRSLLSQLFDRSQPSPHSVSAHDHPRLAPGLASVPVEAFIERRTGGLQSHVAQRDVVEDVDSDSEASDPENAILISHSLANMKLAELARNNRQVQQRRRPLPPTFAQRSHTPYLADISHSTQLSVPLPTNNVDPPAEALPQSPKTVRAGIIERELPVPWRRMLLHHRSLGRPPRRSTVTPPKSPLSNPVTSTTSAATDPQDTASRAATARWDFMRIFAFKAN